MAKFKPLPINDLKERVLYDPVEGLFYSKIDGKQIGFKDNHGSIIICPWFRGRRFQAHRIAWAFTHSDPLDLYIDHINGDRSDNRIVNLRLATHSQNNHNMGIPDRNTSGFKGVSFSNSKGLWEAKVKKNGKTYHFGRHKTKELASVAAMKGRAILHGEFSIEASRG